MENAVEKHVNIVVAHHMMGPICILLNWWIAWCCTHTLSTTYE